MTGEAMVGTCADSLMTPGTCCSPTCDQPASIACLYRATPLHSSGAELAECARCLHHAAEALATKPLILADQWGAGRG